MSPAQRLNSKKCSQCFELRREALDDLIPVDTVEGRNVHTCWLWRRESLERESLSHCQAASQKSLAGYLQAGQNQL